MRRDDEEVLARRQVEELGVRGAPLPLRAVAGLDRQVEAARVAVREGGAVEERRVGAGREQLVARRVVREPRGLAAVRLTGRAVDGGPRERVAGHRRVGQDQRGLQALGLQLGTVPAGAGLLDRDDARVDLEDVGGDAGGADRPLPLVVAVVLGAADVVARDAQRRPPRRAPAGRGRWWRRAARPCPCVRRCGSGRSPRRGCRGGCRWRGRAGLRDLLGAERGGALGAAHRERLGPATVVRGTERGQRGLDAELVGARAAGLPADLDLADGGTGIGDDAADGARTTGGRGRRGEDRREDGDERGRRHRGSDCNTHFRLPGSRGARTHGSRRPRSPPQG